MSRRNTLHVVFVVGCALAMVGLAGIIVDANDCVEYPIRPWFCPWLKPFMGRVRLMELGLALLFFSAVPFLWRTTRESLTESPPENAPFPFTKIARLNPTGNPAMGCLWTWCAVAIGFALLIHFIAALVGDPI